MTTPYANTKDEENRKLKIQVEQLQQEREELKERLNKLHRLWDQTKHFGFCDAQLQESGALGACTCCAGQCTACKRTFDMMREFAEEAGLDSHADFTEHPYYGRIASYMHNLQCSGCDKGPAALMKNRDPGVEATLLRRSPSHEGRENYFSVSVENGELVECLCPPVKVKQKVGKEQHLMILVRHGHNIGWVWMDNLTINVAQSHALNAKRQVYEDDDPCPICAESLQQRPVAVTNCGHVFCQECISRDFASLERCPTCNKAMKDRFTATNNKKPRK
jgi:hypothetical protein